VNDATVLGAGGELSDFQYIQTLLSELATEDYCADDGVQLTPREIYAYLSRVLYNRRNKCAAPARARRAAQAPAGRRKNGDRRPEALRRAGARFDPLWNSLVVGGLEGGAPFLGTVGMIGVHFTDAHIATGAPRPAAPPAAACGAHVADAPVGAPPRRVRAAARAAAVPRAPPARHERGGGDGADARRAARAPRPARAAGRAAPRRAHRADRPRTLALRRARLQVCYYRDKQTTNKFQIARVTAEGVSVSEPFALETQWGYEARPARRPAAASPDGAAARCGPDAAGMPRAAGVCGSGCERGGHVVRRAGGGMRGSAKRPGAIRAV